jgi:hypothetical protein
VYCFAGCAAAHLAAKLAYVMLHMCMCAAHVRCSVHMLYTDQSCTMFAACLDTSIRFKFLSMFSVCSGSHCAMFANDLFVNFTVPRLGFKHLRCAYTL